MSPFGPHPALSPCSPVQKLHRYQVSARDLGQGSWVPPPCSIHQEVPSFCPPRYLSNLSSSHCLHRHPPPLGDSPGLLAAFYLQALSGYSPAATPAPSQGYREAPDPVLPCVVLLHRPLCGFLQQGQWGQCSHTGTPVSAPLHPRPGQRRSCRETKQWMLAVQG